MRLISAQGVLGPEAPGYHKTRDDRTSINLITLARPQLISTAQMITGQTGLFPKECSLAPNHSHSREKPQLPAF